MKKKPWYWSGLFICLVILGLAGWWLLIQKNRPHVPVERQIFVGDEKLWVELVSKSGEIEKGLSDRESIGSDGMLFLFVPAQEVMFWMKDMKFDLDLVWIYQGKIVEITADVPKPTEGQPESDLPLYASPGRVDMVLEVPAGSSRERGFQVGDRVSLPADSSQ